MNLFDRFYVTRRTEALIAIALTVISLGLFSRNFFRPSQYSLGHDTGFHVNRIQSFETCFAEGQIPCRWTSTLGVGFGSPLPGFYPPLTAYVALVFRSFGCTPMISFKLMTFVGVLIGAIGIYLLTKRFVGPIPASVAVTLFIWSPYFAFDAYLRDSVNETWAICMYPWLFLGAYKLFTTSSKATLIITSTALLQTHLLAVIMIAPFYCIWLAVLFFKRRHRFSLLDLFICHFLPALFSTYFLMPLILEKQFVRMDMLDESFFNFRSHFLSFKSVLLNESIPFLTPGFVQTSLVAFVVGLGIAHIPRRTGLNLRPLLIITLCLTGAGAIFLSGRTSVFFWKNISALRNLQFPWRYLGVVVFAWAVVGSFLLVQTLTTRRSRIAANCLILALLAYLSWGFTKPTPDQKRIGPAERCYHTPGVPGCDLNAIDYLPKHFLADRWRPWNFIWLSMIEASDPSTTIRMIFRETTRMIFVVRVRNSPDTVTFKTHYFPGWTASIDGKSTPILVSQPLGLIQVRIPKGAHRVRLDFRRTKIRLYADLLSLISLSATIVFLLGLGSYRLARRR